MVKKRKNGGGSGALELVVYTYKCREVLDDRSH